MIKLAPSVLAADVLHLGKAAQQVKDTGCDMLHFDIMDGVFVPNISFGPHMLEGLKRAVDIFYDVHLMIKDPLAYVDVFAKAGADGLTVHLEAEHFQESIDRIRALGLKVGASVKPDTPVASLVPFFGQLDLILVMTVEPGFGGQKLMPEQLEKIRLLRALGFAGEIEVDGGITLENAASLAQAGADILVMGTAFFKAEEPLKVVEMVHGL